MTNEELLKKAKKDYPLGTKFYSALPGFKDTKGSVTSEEYYIFSTGDVVVNKNCGYSIYSAKSKEWAKIISSPKPKEVQLNYEIY